MKRRQMMPLEDRAGKLADALGSLHEHARSYSRQMVAEASDYNRTAASVGLARAAVRYAKAVERARSES